MDPDAFYTLFNGLWGTAGPEWRPLDLLPGPMVSEEDNIHLTRPIGEDEVWEAMRSLLGDRHLGLMALMLPFTGLIGASSSTKLLARFSTSLPHPLCRLVGRRLSSCSFLSPSRPPPRCTFGRLAFAHSFTRYVLEFSPGG